MESFVLHIRPKDQKTLLPLTLAIPEGVKELKLHLSYDPEFYDGSKARLLLEEGLNHYKNSFETLPIPDSIKQAWMEKLPHIASHFLPLRNQLNLSVYDARGSCKGRWDSNKFLGKWVTLGPNSDYGFENCTLLSGTWTLELEVHGVFSPELTVKIQVETTFYEEKQWFLGEMHSHSCHSDGVLTPNELFLVAKDKGLDFLVLSDHNTISGWPKDPTPLLVIKGLELTTFFGHMVVSGITEYIDWRRSKEDSLAQISEKVRAMGGLLSIAHPFSIGLPLCCGCRYEFDEADYAYADAIEVWSGSWKENALFNWAALHHWDRLLERGLRITALAGRDIHRKHQFDLKDAANTMVKTYACNQELLLLALREGTVCLSSQGTLELLVRYETEAGERSFFMGDTVPRENPWKLTARITNLPRDAVIQFIFDAKVVQETLVSAGSSSLDYTQEAPRRYCRAQILSLEDDRTPLMIANPVYARDEKTLPLLP